MKQRNLLALLCAALLAGAAAQSTPAQTSPTPAPINPAPTPAAPAPAQPAPVQPASTQATPSVTVPAPAQAAPRVPVSNYIISGNAFYSQGKYDQAYTAYRAATELSPLNPQALLGLGRSQTKLRLFDAAMATLKTLTRVAPREVTSYTTLSQTYVQQYMMSSDRASVKGNLDAALNVLKDAETMIAGQSEAERNLSMSKILNERGYVYRLQGKAGPAIDAFKQASSLNPGNSTLLFNLGDMYAATGDLPQAITTLQQAVIADPSDAYNRAYYAKLLALSGNTTAARPEAAQAAKLAPANAYAVGQYGVVSYLAKDPVTARAQLTQAVTLEALRYPEFYYYLGRLDLDEGKLQAARQNLTKAAALDSTMPAYAYYLGLSYERGAGLIAPDRAKAQENYERALKLSPNYQLAKDGLSRLR